MTRAFTISTTNNAIRSRVAACLLTKNGPFPQQQQRYQQTNNQQMTTTSNTILSATTTEDDDDVTKTNANSSLYMTEPEVVDKLESKFLQILRDRGFLHQCTNLSALDQLLATSEQQNNNDDVEPVSAYLGFDATAPSLHVGSLLQIMILRHFQKCHHRPIVLVGGGTSKVGDPTGKDEARVVLTESTIRDNIEGISRVFELFLDFDSVKNNNAAIMVDNDEWLSSLKYLEFLRQYGKYFTINRMLSFESVKQRLAREAPLSFLEFNYMILQAYDFLELYRRHGTILQLGGSDQWGNMVSGTELIRRVCNDQQQQDNNNNDEQQQQLFCLTAPLILTSSGKKMGKTAEGGAIWLNKEQLSEFDYWQFWRNTSDQDVIRFLKLFTELPLEEIAILEQLEGADLNKAKIILADEATALLHGRECLDGIHATVQTMFSGSGSGGSESTEGLPHVYLTKNEIEGGGIRLLDVFLQLDLAKSKKEARRLIQGGGARLEGEKIVDETASLTLNDFGEKNKVTLRAGKKRAGVVELKE